MRIQHELDIPADRGIVRALQTAGDTMNVKLTGTPAQQADQLLESLGI